jgi:hypothetical protein
LLVSIYKWIICGKKIPPNHLYVSNQMTFFITNQMDACLFPFTIGFSAGGKNPTKAFDIFAFGVTSAWTSGPMTRPILATGAV